ncbi:MAG: MoxR family ATPase [Dehalococcoidia bacterium]
MASKIDPAVEKATAEFCGKFQALRDEIGKAIVGHEDVVDGVLTALLVGGHVLIEGVPGLGKTYLIRTLAEAVDLKFSRIQFTPDLMPADIIGTTIISEDPATGKRAFEFQTGPLFAQIVLADEINRATPKTQSALLEAMQEHTVTVGGTCHKLEEPFFVMATQNPIEQEGTYPLPEAQVDRFMFKVIVSYPTKEEERRILDRMTAAGGEPRVSRIIQPEELLRARDVVRSIYVDDRVRDYVVNLVHATREPKAYGLDMAELIRYGASPRATIYLLVAGRAHAFLRRRGFVTPEDIKAVGPDVLRHRVILSYEAEAEEVTSEEVIRRVFDTIEVP